MKFEKDARKKGISDIITGTVIIAVLTALQFFFFYKPDTPTALVIFFWSIGTLVSLVFIRSGISLLKSGGSWLITVDLNGINWASPNEDVDSSFNIKISEILNVETQIRRKGRKSNRTKYSYSIKLKNGTEQKLSSNSGINLVQVITELERLGIAHEQIRI